MHAPTPEEYQVLADNSSIQRSLPRYGEVQLEEKQTLDLAE